MEIALLLYDHQKVSQAKARLWCKSFEVHQPILLNNKPGSLQEGELLGDNTAYEFSAYAQAIKLFKGDGPFLLANDTLFHNHLSGGWRRLLNKRIRKSFLSPCVIGDIRREKIAFPEKNRYFLASWLFLIPDRPSLVAFAECLEVAFTKAELPSSSAYENHVNHWLERKSVFGGWHGKADEAALIRKRKVIRLEHALSQELEIRGLMQSFGGAFYTILRLFERLKTRFNVQR